MEQSNESRNDSTSRSDFDWAVYPVTYVTPDGERHETEEWVWVGPLGLPAETIDKIREAIGNSRTPEDPSHPVVVSNELFDTFERILSPRSRYMDTALAMQGHENLLYQYIPIIRANDESPLARASRIVSEQQDRHGL